MRRGFVRFGRMFPRQSLRVRLILILFTTFLIGLAAALSFFYWEAIGTQAGLRERSLQEQARELLDTLHANHWRTGGFTPLPANLAYTDTKGTYGYTLYDSWGNVLAVSPNRVSKGPLPLTQVPSQTDKFGPVFFVGPTRTAAMTTRAPDLSFFLVVSRDDPDPKTLAESLIEQDAAPLIVLSPFVLLTLTLIVAVINRTLRPLQRASSEASRIGPASSIARVTTRGLPSEVIPLVTAFNGALDRLSSAYQFEKRLTADAAHELRTPLAVLRMRLESARLSDGMPLNWEAVQRDFAQIDRLTTQLLDLARKEHGEADTHQTKVNLARTARESAAMMLPFVESAGRSLEVIAPDAVLIDNGSEDDLRDMLRNLIENALAHGKGSITISVRRVGDRHQGFATITVTDEGSGVPERLRSIMFERFRKGDASKSGAGLGLAIVRQVAERHGGTAEFLGGSTESRIQIRLPFGTAE